MFTCAKPHYVFQNNDLLPYLFRKKKKKKKKKKQELIEFKLSSKGIFYKNKSTKKL